MLPVNVYCLPAFQIFLFVDVNTEFKIVGWGLLGRLITG